MFINSQKRYYWQILLLEISVIIILEESLLRDSNVKTFLLLSQVADELVREFSDPEKHMSPTDQVCSVVCFFDVN